MSIIWSSLYNLVFNPFTIIILIPLFLPIKKFRLSILPHIGIWKRLEQKRSSYNKEKPLIWFHAASAGEYLQAKFVIQKFLTARYQVFISVTSISGYRWLERENNAQIHFDFMPLDTKHNTKKALEILKPAAMVFLKNDIWPNLKMSARIKNIPVFLINAPELKHKSGVLKSVLKFLYSDFNAIFTVSNDARQNFLKIAPNIPCSVCGDAKFDLVNERKKERHIRFSSVKPKDVVLLMGSVWRQDLRITQEILKEYLKKMINLKIIIAPHEVGHTQIESLVQDFSEYNPFLYSQIGNKKTNFKVLIVDTVGDLFFLYENSSIAYIGGGFSSGIHNILEPAAMENALIFGPRHEKFPEARLFLQEKCAYSIKSSEEFRNIMTMLIESPDQRNRAAKNCLKITERNRGASEKIFKGIIRYLQASRISLPLKKN